MMDQRHAEDYIDRIVPESGLVRAADSHLSFYALQLQTLAGNLNQFGRDIDPNHSGSPMNEGYDLLTRSAAHIED